MRTQHVVVRAASSPSRPKRDGLGYPAEAQLLPRADARSGGALCTDAMKPVIFRIDRVGRSNAVTMKLLAPAGSSGPATPEEWLGRQQKREFLPRADAQKRRRALYWTR